jgi:hypothetical protein
VLKVDPPAGKLRLRGQAKPLTRSHPTDQVRLPMPLLTIYF